VFSGLSGPKVKSSILQLALYSSALQLRQALKGRSITRHFHPYGLEIPFQCRIKAIQQHHFLPNEHLRSKAALYLMVMPSRLTSSACRCTPVLANTDFS
jgi:hypothetical protein